MTIKTEAIIKSLVSDAVAVKQLASPVRHSLYLIIILFIYAAGVGGFLGFRVDLFAQLLRPFFLAEILLLLFIIFSSVLSAVHLLFPDRYQKKGILYLPTYIMCALILILVFQEFLPLDSRMVLPIGKVHAMECSICIASIAMIPSALIFKYLRKGASVYPFLSGVYAVLASSGIGCLMLRLSEANDSILHIIMWHYIPTLIFAAIGAFIGKIFIKW